MIIEYSDDEVEAVPRTVSNYYFVNEKDEPISFSELPVQWNESEGLECKGKHIFLHGTTDDGLQKIYKQVTAWKFDFLNGNPEIYVLSGENNWIKLQKPRKSFEDTIRTILITVHCLYFVRKNTETSGRSLWDDLSKVLSSYDAKPSENDLIDNISLIREAVKRDETLARSKFLATFLEAKPGKKKAFDKDTGTTTQNGFVVDDDMIDAIEEDDVSDEDDLFDSVCAICDNGGDLLCCEGRCMRSFHATIEAGSESMCESLRLSDEQVEAIQSFVCKNCQYKQHQCFSCGELGSSDKLSGAEVFPCVSATCGRFYHPHCVAKLLHRESATEAEELQKKIAAGESFTCSIHKCLVCKQGEDKMDPDLQFAVCRRCPKSYHRKCLPRKIAFEDIEEEGILQRAWEDLIPNRILIYCLKHVIDDDIGTPTRNHIKFPDDGQKRDKQAPPRFSSKGKSVKRERHLPSKEAPRKRTLGKAQKGVKLSSTINVSDSSKKRVRRSIGPDFSKKREVVDAVRKPFNKTIFSKVSKPLINKDPESVNSVNENIPASEHKQTLMLDDDAKGRIFALMKDATSSITLEEIIEKLKVPTTHCTSSKYVVDKSITLGKVEGSVEALRAALQKLEEGCSMEDAKAVCEPGLLHQVVRWKNKLKVYLAPFLYGMRYTSYGRHFTKVDKLKEIVDRLHCYVQDGDMVVDFCCGANDFSGLMKNKLDATGKKCSYKNYDVLQAKNDFNFEKRDWMSVHPKELPSGSQLIMGLNPPFGVNASLANQFIDKALEFKPKLLILIVPQETERLDKKNTPYDLVWEDSELLAGKSFYLPGSVDVNDNQLEDWNVNPPLLYLWSRPDWTAKHKAIAQQHGHLSGVVHEWPHLDDPNEPLFSDYPMEDRDLNDQTLVSVDDYTVQSEVDEQSIFLGASVFESQKEGYHPSGNGDSDVNENHSHGENQSNEGMKQRERNDGKHKGGLIEASEKGKGKGHSSPISKMDEIMHRHPPSNATGDRTLDGPSFGEGDRNFDHGVTELHLSFQNEFGDPYSDDIAMGYRLNSEEPYLGASNIWSPGTGLGPDYEVGNSDQFSVYQRGSTDTHGYRPFANEMEDYARESVMRPDVRSYGQQEPDILSQRGSFLAGQDHGFPSLYSHLDSAADSPYCRTNGSAMERYAPRLDELNHTRMNTSGFQPPTSGRNGIPDHRPPQGGGHRVGTLGFAPGPYHPFSQQNSSGWLND